MKKTFVLAVAVVLCCFLAAACDTSGETGTGISTIIEGIDLTELVDTPWNGTAYQTAITEQPEFAGAIVWRMATGESGPFIVDSFNPAPTAGQFHEARVTLAAKPGFTFTETAENAFSHRKGWASNPAGNGDTLLVTIRFPQTPSANDITLTATNLVAELAPATRDETPVLAINHAQYSANIAWQTAGGAEHSGPFAAETAYRALVSLTPKTGYTLMGLEADSFIYPGSQSISYDLKTRIISILFEETLQEGVDNMVSLFNLTSLLTVPLHRGTPAAALTADTNQYEGAAVEWFYVDGGADDPVVGTLTYGKTFKAVITLAAKEGYTFDGISPNTFAHTGATVLKVENTAGSGLVSVYFSPAKYVLGTLSYPRLGTGGTTTANPAGWNTVVQSCCWPYSSSNDRSGNILVSSRNPGLSATGAPSSSGSTTTAISNSSVYWDYAWEGTATSNRSSWQFFVGANGTYNSSTTNVQITGWQGGILNGDESGRGHREAWETGIQSGTVPASIAGRGLKQHVWTFDLQEVRNNIATFGIYPRNDTGKMPVEFEIFYSDNPIGPLTDVDDPANGVTALGMVSIQNISATNAWSTVNLVDLAPNNEPISARYIQLRVYWNQSERTKGEEWWNTPSFTQVRLGVAQD